MTNPSTRARGARPRGPHPTGRPRRPTSGPLPPGSSHPAEVAAARARVKRALTVVALVVVILIVALVWASKQNTTATEPAPAPPTPIEAPDAAPPQAGGWDTAAEAALATRVMPQFPDAAAKPQTLAPAGLAAIAVPTATRTNTTGVGEGFPATPEGAIGQLAALEVAGLTDLNPQTYNEAYRSISLPGAPNPSSTPLGAQIAQVYDGAVVEGTDSSPIASRWQLAGALVKGVTNGGRSVTVCVVGELQAAQASSTEAGTGDCQSMRFTGTEWRIAPGPVAALAPSTWPGTPSFVRAGYHPTTGGPA